MSEYADEVLKAINFEQDENYKQAYYQLRKAMSITFADHASEVARLKEVIEDGEIELAKIYNELRTRENDIIVLQKYAKHYFSPSSNDKDVCTKCGNNFRDIRFHLTVGEKQ